MWRVFSTNAATAVRAAGHRHPSYGLPWGEDRLVPIFLATLAIRQQTPRIMFESAAQIGGLATPGGLVTFLRVQLGKPMPIPSPVVLGQVSEKFREAVRAQAERQRIPIYQFRHKERKDDIANDFRGQRGVRDQIVFIGVAQEKAKAFSGTKVTGQFQFNRNKTVYVNHYYFYIDDEDFGPLFLKVCSYAPWGNQAVHQ
jgi:hypothetical protein